MTQVTEQPAVGEVRVGRRLLRWGLLLLLLDVLVGGTILGLQARRWTFEFTKPTRHQYDITRNYTFGSRAIEQGFLNVYENQLLTQPTENERINYPPLRLALFEGWAWWNQGSAPDQNAVWKDNYDFNRFVLWFYTAMEWLAAIAAFLLVRHWIWRTGPPQDDRGLPRLLTGGMRGSIAFVLLWFCPVLLLLSQGWISPNVLVIPFFLWAVLLASWECWFISGVVMGLGVMFQGQQLFTLGMFILWPLFAWQFGRALRWTSGFVFTCGLIVSGWMLTYAADQNPQTSQRIMDWPAAIWVIAAGAAVLLMNGYRLLPAKWRWTWLPAALAAACVIAWPGFKPWSGWSWVLIGSGLVALASAKWLPFRRQGFAAAFVVGLTLLLCMQYHHGSTAWWRLGFEYGTERHMAMAVGPANNLGALLNTRFAWSSPNLLAFTLSAKTLFAWPAEARAITIRELLIGTYAVLFVLSCIAVARQWRKNDRRFLVTVVVPWVLMYSIPAQIHERYLVFPAAIGVVAVGCSYGLGMLAVFFGILGALQVFDGMSGPEWAHVIPFLNIDARDLARALYPDIAWAVLAATGVFFFAAFARSAWRRPLTAQLPLEKKRD